MAYPSQYCRYPRRDRVAKRTARNHRTCPVNADLRSRRFIREIEIRVAFRSFLDSPRQVEFGGLGVEIDVIPVKHESQLESQT